jgi:hypothetical protein
MPEKGAKVIGLQKDSALGLEAEFREAPVILLVEVFRTASLSKGNEEVCISSGANLIRRPLPNNEVSCLIKMP